MHNKLSKIVYSLFILSFLVAILSGVGWNKLVNNAEPTPFSKVLSASPEPDQNTIEISFNNNNFKIAWFLVEDSSKIKLISNLSDPLSAKKARDSLGCKFLASAGFYSKDSNHLGIFISEGKQISPRIKSELFDSFFTINYFDTPRISRTLPKDPLRIALQSGPMLIENADRLSLSIKNDKPSRRIVAAVTGENKAIFIAIYAKESAFSGPMLVDLPRIVDLISKDIDLGIADAINLDGGSASAFYSGNTSLSEISPVGGFFCSE